MKNSHSLLLPLIAINVCIAGTVGQAAVINSDGSPQGNRNNFGGTVGTQFTVGGVNFLVDALGFEDPNGDGLAQAHQVGLWDSAGTLLASVTVPAGTGAVLEDVWRYVPLPTTVALTAGQTYSLGAEVFGGGDAWSDASDSGGSGIPDFTHGLGIVDANPTNVFVGGGFARPTNNGGGIDLRWAPGNARGEPEPLPFGTVALIDTDGSPQANRNNFGGTVGNQFTIGSSDFLVDALGFEDAGGDGLAQAHQVGLWDSTGTLLASTTIPAGTAGILADGWRYVELAGVVALTAGETYTVGAEVFGGGDAWSDANDSGGSGIPDFRHSSVVLDTNPSNVFAVGGFARPINNGGGTDFRWAPANVRGEPESSILTAIVVHDGSQQGNRNNFGGTVGNQFAVGADDVVVDALGFEDPEGDGLVQAHQVGLWDSAGTLLAAVTVPAGSGATLEDGWRYVELPEEITLAAGQRYSLGAEVFSGGDMWSDASDSGGNGAADFTLGLGLTDASPANVFVGGGIFARPTNNGLGADFRWAPANARVAAAIQAVPEPSTFALAALGLLGLGLVDWRRRKRAN